MKTKILLTLLVVTFLAACKKDKYQTKPQLTFKGVNSNVIPQRGIVTFTLEVTDAEGDIQDTLFVEKVVPNCAASYFKAGYKVPNFNAVNNLKAEIDVTYVLNFNNGENAQLPGPQCPRNDTATFRFWIKDKAKNVSDTVSTKSPVILLR